MAQAQQVDDAALLAQMQQKLADLEAKDAARELALARSEHVAAPVYVPRKQQTPRSNFSEDARRRALEAFQPGITGALFDSEQLQAALKVAQELTAESSVGEYRAALSLLASTAEVLHSGLRKEREALRIELLKIDELRLSFSGARKVIEPAHNADHWNSFKDDDARREHIAYEVDAYLSLHPIKDRSASSGTGNPKGKTDKSGKKPSKPGTVNVPPSPSSPATKRTGPARSPAPGPSKKRRKRKKAPPKRDDEDEDEAADEAEDEVEDEESDEEDDQDRV